MTDRATTATAAANEQSGRRQRAMQAYGKARGNASETISEAPLIALAGGIAAGALIAALLPRTQAENRLVRPTARRVKSSARAAYTAARNTGSDRLSAISGTGNGEGIISSLLGELTDAAKASANAALDAARSADKR